MSRAARAFLRNPLALTGSLIVLLVLLVALLAPSLARESPTFLDPSRRLLPPGPGHPLGTDDVGRDVLSRVVYGSRVSLLVGAWVVFLSSLFGLAFGLLAGYFRRLDNLLMRVMDGVMAFPGILLAIAIMASLGPRVSNVVIALSVVYTPRLARVARAQVLVVRETQYVEAAEAAGAPPWRILLRHVLPNCLSPIVVQAAAIFALAVLSEAALSFLGAGAPPEIPSWGNVLAEGRNYMRQAWWMTVFPGLAIMFTVLGLNMLGDGIRDVLDPRTSRR